MELKDLEKMTVNELRELAHQYEDVKGAVGMKKEALIDVLCEKMGIEKKHALPKGIGRHAMKMRLREMATKRDEALAAHDHKALKRIRTRMRRVRHRLRDVVELAERGKIKAKEGAAPAPPSS